MGYWILGKIKMKIRMITDMGYGISDIEKD